MLHNEILEGLFGGLVVASIFALVVVAALVACLWVWAPFWVAASATVVLGLPVAFILAIWCVSKFKGGQ